MPDSITSLINEFTKLPGIGEKSAERITYFLLKRNENENLNLGKYISELKSKVKFCKICGNFTESNICNICSDTTREISKICIVEQPKDIKIFEKLHIYKGLYHVLGDLLSPLNGIGPDKLNIRSLTKRLEEKNFNEIIIALPQTTEGEMTALYIKKLLSKYPIKITRLISGIPVGSDLEYVDMLTLEKSFEGRTTF